jgi:hypothetical protein
VEICPRFEDDNLSEIFFWVEICPRFEDDNLSEIFFAEK